MAAQRFSDLYIPDLEHGYVNERSTTKSLLWRSGIVVPNGDFQGMIGSGAGNRFTTPFNLSIEDQVAEDGNDDPADNIAQSTWGTSSYTSAAATRTKSWGHMNLAAIFAGNNPVGVLNQQLCNFWVNNHQLECIASLNGLIADNVANDGGDMVVDVYSDVASPAAGAFVNADNIIDTLHTMGDMNSELEGGAIIMHSAVKKVLQKAEPNNFIPASASNIGFATYLGLAIIEDDGVPAIAGTNQTEYTTYLVGAGVFQYAQDPRMSNEEWDRSITAGNGTGNDFIVTRRRFLLAPQGFDMITSSVSDMLTRTELATAAVWDRKVASRRQIKLAVLKSNA